MKQENPTATFDAVFYVVGWLILFVFIGYGVHWTNKHPQPPQQVHVMTPEEKKANDDALLLMGGMMMAAGE
jgi:hypothetical protein